MIQIIASELKPALAGLAKVVSGKAALECIRCVRVDASPEHVHLTGTDLDVFAKVTLPAVIGDPTASFLLPLDRLQSATRRLPPTGLLHLEPGKITCEMGEGTVSESITAPKIEDFPEEWRFEERAHPLPESFGARFTEAMGCSSTDASRYVLNGVHLDVSDRSGHYLVATDGRHLFSANSFALPLQNSLTIPKHKLLAWRGLADLPWALGTHNTDDRTLVRLVAGNWTLTVKALDGTYPNWRQVVPRAEQHGTTVTLPDDHDFAKLVQSLPVTDAKDVSVDLVIKGGTVAVQDSAGTSTIPLTGAKARGADLTIRLNRNYLVKAFHYGLTAIGLKDAISPLHFTHEGRQMVVMPMRVADVAPVTAPDDEAAKPAEPTPTAPPEPQPERKTMTATNGQTVNGTARPTVQSSAEKPSIETAIEKLDVLKVTFREAIAGLTELTALLRQSVRDQRAGEKELQQFRQTLRTLQNVRI